MRFRAKIVGAVIAGMIAVPAVAGSVTVNGTSDIWLAGQTSGAAATGYFGSDTIPANAPRRLTVSSGATVTFAATGSTSVDGGCFAGPAGGCYSDQSGFSPSPWSGLYNGPADALIGIFLDASTPAFGTSGGYQGPLAWVAGPDYQNPLNLGPGVYTPGLNQIFLIGSGLGESFIAPTGATRLYLAVADSIGGSTGNLGALSVEFTGAATALPEPAAWALLIAGFGLVGAMARRRTVALAA